MMTHSQKLGPCGDSTVDFVFRMFKRNKNYKDKKFIPCCFGHYLILSRFISMQSTPFSSSRTSYQTVTTEKMIGMLFNSCLYTLHRFQKVSMKKKPK